MSLSMVVDSTSSPGAMPGACFVFSAHVVPKERKVRWDFRARPCFTRRLRIMSCAALCNEKTSGCQDHGTPRCNAMAACVNGKVLSTDILYSALGVKP